LNRTLLDLGQTLLDSLPIVHSPKPLTQLKKNKKRNLQMNPYADIATVAKLKPRQAAIPATKSHYTV
jgi:hypothetical protein